MNTSFHVEGYKNFWLVRSVEKLHVINFFLGCILVTLAANLTALAVSMQSGRCSPSVTLSFSPSLSSFLPLRLAFPLGITIRHVLNNIDSDFKNGVTTQGATIQRGVRERQICARSERANVYPFFRWRSLLCRVLYLQNGASVRRGETRFTRPSVKSTLASTTSSRRGRVHASPLSSCRVFPRSLLPFLCLSISLSLYAHAFDCVCACVSLSPSLVLARSRMTGRNARPRWRRCIVFVDDAEWIRRVRRERASVVGFVTILESEEDGCDDRAGVQRVGRFVSADRHWHEGKERLFYLGSTITYTNASRAPHNFHVRPMFGTMFTLTLLWRFYLV